MGREIRRVPPQWQHPKEKRYDHRLQIEVDVYQPMYDEPYSKAISEWIENHILWEKGQHPDQINNEDSKECRYFAQWEGNAPDVEYYRPEWSEEEATWYQVYETVSEGTPVTPPFKTQDELIDYLVANGDFWDQKRRKDGGPFSMPCAPWDRTQAEKFVKGTGWAVSMVIDNGVIKSGVDAL